MPIIHTFEVGREYRPERHPAQIRDYSPDGRGAHRGYVEECPEFDVYRLPGQYQHGIVHHAEPDEGYGLM